MKKYQLPEFLASAIAQKKYERWLRRKAAAHVRRDKKRGNKTATSQDYKEAIHRAVQGSGGLDVYTGERLDWALVSTYNNEDAKRGGRKYKKEFALLPSVDHVGDPKGPANFVMCSWRTNDAKNDLTVDEFVDLCRKVLATVGQ